jgi:hypothetical protein
MKGAIVAIQEFRCALELARRCSKEQALSPGILYLHMYTEHGTPANC